MRTWIDRNRALALGLLAVIVAAAVIVAVIALGGDDDDTTAPTTTSTAATTSTSSAPSTTTTVAPSTTVPAPFDTASAVWPAATSSTRYTDPVAATTGFAAEFVGFTDPIVSAFRSSDAESGEVDVRARADGPVTTVAVRQLATDETWWVIGATTPNIELTEPAPLATISSPVRLQGRSTAFEGTVQTEVRGDGAREPLAKGFVMGGATGTLEPFTGTLTFPPPPTASGAIVLYTASSENNQVAEATVTRVRFARG